MNIQDIISIIDAREMPRDRKNWPVVDIASDAGDLHRLLVPYVLKAWLEAQPVWPEAIDAAQFEAAARQDPWDFTGHIDADRLPYYLGMDYTVYRGAYGCFYAARRPGTDTRADAWHDSP
jgi:hypothetical protein